MCGSHRPRIRNWDGQPAAPVTTIIWRAGLRTGICTSRWSRRRSCWRFQTPGTPSATSPIGPRTWSSITGVITCITARRLPCFYSRPGAWRLGKDLPEASAALAFAFLGYVFSCGVLLRLLSWTKVRPSVPWLVALLLAVGLCPAIPYLLLRVKVYEVAILGGYFCMSAGFWFLAKAVLRPKAAPHADDPGWSHVRAGHRLPSALRAPPR